MEDLTTGVLSLAVGGPSAPTGQIVQIAPRAAGGCVSTGASRW
jgi:hypothetical protein